MKKEDMVTYVKEFDKFEDGINAMRMVSTTIEKTFYTLPITHGAAAMILCDIISHNIPSIDSEEYPSYYAIDLSADRCSFRTPHYISFGWKILEDIVNNNRTYSFRIQFFNKRAGLKNVESKLIQADWNKLLPSYTRNTKPGDVNTQNSTAQGKYHRQVQVAKGPGDLEKIKESIDSINVVKGPENIKE